MQLHDDDRSRPTPREVLAGEPKNLNPAMVKVRTSRKK
jgi:hypothetical protein